MRTEDQEALQGNGKVGGQRSQTRADVFSSVRVAAPSTRLSPSFYLSPAPIRTLLPTFRAGLPVQSAVIQPKSHDLRRVKLTNQTNYHTMYHSGGNVANRGGCVFLFFWRVGDMRTLYFHSILL